MSGLPSALDRFEITTVLGKGGMGTVYLGRDRTLGRRVAIKVLNADDLFSEEARSRFLREARAAASIRHPNVATIYEVGQTAEGEPYIVMEYCEGETLSQRIRRQQGLSTPEFFRIARQIAAGLTAAHAVGVVHRDIKSANIMIEPPEVVKILDFGLAKVSPREFDAAGETPSFASTSGHFFGTLHFLAPEQARGLPADERSDLFSAGVVFYHMASGRLPFSADGALLTLEKIRDAEPEPFVPIDPTFPPAAAKIISRLLQKNPADRIRTASELAADLDEIDTPTARISTHHTRSLLGPTVRRPKRFRTIVAALVLAIVLTAAYYVQQHAFEPMPAATMASPPSPIRSMAVLPLNNLAGNAADDFLSVGLADALVTKLQSIPSLQVRPTSAVLEFREHKIDSSEARRKLGVDSLLEGNFLTAGDLVRVNLQLTDSRTGYNVWAASVDGKRDDLLKLIDDVSARTVSGLNEKLGVRQTGGSRSEPRSSNPQAFEQYLRARALTGSFVPEDFDEQLAALRRAVELDPNFAAAYADLAIALSLGHARSMTRGNGELERAEWYARQAVRLDPNLPQAHLALGRVFVRNPERFRESVREVLAALRLSATDTHALNSIATYFVSTGEMEKAECIGRQLMRVDPSSNEVKMSGYWYVNAVDPEGALENAHRALGSEETEIGGHDIRGVAYVLQGNLAAAEREADALMKLAPRHYLGKSLRAMIAAAREDRLAAEAALRSFEADAKRNHWAAFRAAIVRARLQDDAEAVKWVQQAAALGHHSWYALVKHPWLQSLQADPAFQAVVSAIKEDLDDVRDDVTGVYNLICG